MNKVILLGRLTRDPELRTTPSGVSVTSFSIAVNRRFQKDQTDFINCVAWRQTAEFVSKYFAKGNMISVVGSLQTGRYEKDGQTHYTTDVVVDEVYFTGSKAESSGSVGAMPNASQEDSTFNIDEGFMPMPADDDLPF